MKKIKIAYFVGNMNCGGTETMLMNVIRNINFDKFEIDFIFNSMEKSWYENEIIELGANIIRIKNIKNNNIKKYLNQLTELFTKNKYNVVHSHTFLHSAFVMKAAKEAKVPIRIAHSHSAMDLYEKGLIYKIKKFFLRKMILKYSTELLACSTEAGICLFGNEFLKRGKIFRNPIRINEIEKVIKDKKIEDKIKVENSIVDELIIGHVGRFEEVKNHEFIVEICKQLKEQGFKYKIILIGDGSLFNKIKEKVKEKDLESNFIFTGNIKNVYEYMNIFDILIMPSFYEGLPLTLIEAQALGIYSIVSKNISKEADLNMNILEYLPIDKCEIWCNKIINFKKNNFQDKQCFLDKVKDTDYSIANAINRLEKIYDARDN